MTTSALAQHLSPADRSGNPKTELAEMSGKLKRQPVLFIGGSKDGQVLSVPFEDGGVCVCLEMQAQVLLGGHVDGKEGLTLPIHLEPYYLAVVDHGRKIAVSRDLQLSRYCQEVHVREDQLSGAAVRQLRAAIRADVAAIGGHVLTPAVGQEDVTINILTCSDESDDNRPLRTLRGECWLVTRGPGR